MMSNALLDEEPDAAVMEARKLVNVPLLGLDIDGVLNGGRDFGRGLDADKLDFVAAIYEATGCEIVLTSDRRYSAAGCRWVIGALGERGVDTRTMCRALPVNVVIDGEMRQDERQRFRWENCHGIGIRAGRSADWAAALAAEPRTSWVLVDDDTKHWQDVFWQRLWRTDNTRGLTLLEARRVIAMLKDPEMRGNVACAAETQGNEDEGRADA